MSETKIGKYAIESLTRSMYEDSRCIYREYVQNAADQIDIACEQHLDPSNYYDIQIWIDEENRRIEIEDTATGVSKERVNLLRDVACSTKHRGKQKGFRGIGRLGGLGYCSNLIFITSFKGEDVQTIMRWDADRMNQLIDDEMDDSEAGAVIDQCVSYEYKHEDSEKHYFRVVMEHVTDDKLLQVDAISQYLSMVAPVDYPTAFSKFGHQIKQYMRDNNLSLDTYNLFVNGDQIYKGYTTRIVDAKNGDYDVTDIQFFSQKDSNEKFLYWGWYSVSELRGQIPAYNIPYGMRLRCKNIQIGDETTCRRFFNADGDRRFAQYFYGEVNVVNPDLQPDGRRDYFREGDLRRHFEKLLTTDFQILKVLCNEASDIRGTVKKFTTAVNGQETIQKKRTTGFVSQAEKDSSEQQFQRYQKDKEKYAAQFSNMQAKSQQAGSPLSFMFQNVTETQPAISQLTMQQDPVQTQTPSVPESDITKLRTDNATYCKFGKKEKYIIQTIYDAIYAAIADDMMRESLINRIESALIK